MRADPTLAAALVVLDRALGAEGDLGAALRELAATVRAAVPSSLGMFVATDDESGFGFTVWGSDGGAPPPLGGPARTSLALPDRTGRRGPVVVVLLGGAPGAFVDLAADLAHLTATPLAELALDRHLDGSGWPSGSAALLAASAVDQAVGVLIGRGLTCGQARYALAGRAAESGVTLGDVASGLLEDPARRGGRWWGPAQP